MIIGVMLQLFQFTWKPADANTVLYADDRFAHVGMLNEVDVAETSVVLGRRVSELAASGAWSIYEKMFHDQNTVVRTYLPTRYLL